MNALLAQHILSVATVTWFWGFLATAILFGVSCLVIRWQRFSIVVRRYLLRQVRYDYKDIFKHYLSRINSIGDTRQLYKMILQVVSEIVGSEDASLLLEDNGVYLIKESFGSKPVSFQVSEIEEFLKWIATYRHPISRYQIVNKKAFAKVKGIGLNYCIQLHAEACVPLFLGTDVVGMINIGHRKTGELFDWATLELLEILGGQMAVATRNASLYEDLARRNVGLHELSRLKNQLLANVSHELRTPLNGIIGLADSMAEGGDGTMSEEQLKHLKMISVSGKGLMNTVGSMVDLAKLEANHLSLNVKRVNLSKLVTKVVANVRPTESGAVRLTVLENMPPIYGDEAWLNKLFTHIISNSVKYTPNGEIVVDAEKSGEMLKVGIHDTGIGIAPEQQTAIFNGFVQVDGDVNRQHEGIGIGLAISKKVVELHGGRIWLSSSLGRGSHFFFTLPLKPTTIKSVELA